MNVDLVFGLGLGIILGWAIALWRWVKPLEEKLERIAKRDEGAKGG